MSVTFQKYNKKIKYNTQIVCLKMKMLVDMVEEVEVVEVITIEKERKKESF